jgi:hypothetical protein
MCATRRVTTIDQEGEEEDGGDAKDLPGVDYAAIDAILARSEATINRANSPDNRLDEWHGVLGQAENLPAVLQAIVALAAWNELSVLQHAPWRGWLYCASILRQAGITTGAHLAAINIGLKTIPAGRRRHRDRETGILAIAHGFLAAAEIGKKEHDRLTLPKNKHAVKLAITHK